MKIVLTAFLSFALFACNAPFHTNGFTPGDKSTVISFKKKSSLTRYVQPSEVFTGAFFKYKETKGQWPADFLELNTKGDFRKAYDDLFINGLTDLRFEKMSNDSLIMKFEFSKSKYAQSRGYNNTYIPDGVRGKYIFFSDGKVKMFTVDL